MCNGSDETSNLVSIPNKAVFSFPTKTGLKPKLHLFSTTILPQPRAIVYQTGLVFVYISAFHSHEMSSPLWATRTIGKSTPHLFQTSSSHVFKCSRSRRAIGSGREALGRSSILTSTTLFIDGEPPFTTSIFRASSSSKYFSKQFCRLLSFPGITPSICSFSDLSHIEAKYLDKNDLAFLLNCIAMQSKTVPKIRWYLPSPPEFHASKNLKTSLWQRTEHWSW